MEIERVLVDGKPGALVAGLAWRPPSGGKLTRAALHEARSLTDATAHVVAHAGTRSVYGLFQPRPSEEDKRLPKGALSAAGVFALHVGARSPNAVLLLQMPSLDGQGARFYLVVLDDGLPAIDAILFESEMHRVLGNEDRPMWTDDAVRYPAASDANLDWLAELAREPSSKSCTITGFPINPWPVLIGTAALAAAAGAWVLWQQHQVQTTRANAVAAAALEDPAPRYLAALAASRSAAMSDRVQMLSITRQLFQLPAFVPGWQLRSVDCSAVTQTCNARWIRRGGRFEELRAAFPKSQLLTGAPGVSSAVADLDSGQLRWPAPVARQPLPAPAQLLSYDAAVIASGNLFQRWKTANLVVDFKPPSLWPATVGVPATLHLANSVASGEVIASDVPAPFAAEVLASAPAWLSWNTVHLEVADLAVGSARTQLKFTFGGTYYVAI